MDQYVYSMDMDENYPILFIPKKCTTLQTNCAVTDSVYINVNITSTDIEGNLSYIYTGFCNIKLLDGYDNVHMETLDEATPEFVEDPLPIIVTDSTSSYNLSQVWIDPERSPHVYNQYDALESHEQQVSRETHTSRITVQEHSTYITQNIYNYKEHTNYSQQEDFEHKKFRKVHIEPNQQNFDPNLQFYEEDEYSCGVFLSQLPREIMNEKETKDREDRKLVDMQSENEALKQLMSSDIQSGSKQRKTILFLGHDAHCGQTIQKIALEDPSMECNSEVCAEVDNEVEIEETKVSSTNHKKYQCDKCKQIFDQISAFNQHMIGGHRSPRVTRSCPRFREPDEDYKINEKYICSECGKVIKNKEKFEMHCMAHGDPERECSKCRKVFASKFTLRTHRKIHNRKHQCTHCPKTYNRSSELKAHVNKVHFRFMCDSCDYVGASYSELNKHMLAHDSAIKEYDHESLDDLSDGDLFKTSDLATSSYVSDQTACDSAPTLADELKEDEGIDVVEEADLVIAKVISNQIFQNQTRKHKRYNKKCDVCNKTFDRIGDLKRHLIEHIIRSTLAKTPVCKDGTLKILCEVCQSDTFYKIDRYKAHLREHAKLTIYKCTFCDKSFSDSSNFSKHKKIHGSTYLQCDLCQRKFNSKKMITQHMEYHKQNNPIPCEYCGKYFYFESMLNKHVKCAHTKEGTSKFRCRFCHEYFKTLRDKWDHEWTIHNVRKMIVDCLICGSKYRKYSELKRHCNDVHDVEIPPAKKLLRRRKHSSWKYVDDDDLEI